MATVNDLKRALRQKATAPASCRTQPLSSSQYDAGFDILMRGSQRTTYQDFIVPQLSLVLAPLFNSRFRISVLEVGPGPTSVLGYLSGSLRRKIKRYAAFEPNNLFAAKLAAWLSLTAETGSQLPYLESPPDIHQAPFVLDSNMRARQSTSTSDGVEQFDVVLFCHSMYGMKPRHRFIEQALEMLHERQENAMVVVFHRDECLHLDGLICHRMASFPAGVISVADDDEVLDSFAPFIAGFVMQDETTNKVVQAEWRKTCRAYGLCEKGQPHHLLFSSPTVMAAFTRHATCLPELTTRVPAGRELNKIKNWEARLHRPVSIVRPTEICQVQECVRWALKHQTNLIVIGGGHSGHCVWPNVVSVDMSAFNEVHIVPLEEDAGHSGLSSETLVVAGAGCKTGDIVGQTMAAGVTVPLGARPSIGAGLWLQGGIGHIARLHGLACDAIVGAIMVSVHSSEILCIGCVPSQHWPTGAVQSPNEADLLWAMKGAGTNFGIVVSVIFKAYAAPTFLTRTWVVSLADDFEARLRLHEFDSLVARELDCNCSADAYLYGDAGQLHLSVTMFEASTKARTSAMFPVLDELWGLKATSRVEDGVSLFENEMYMSGMHGGHGSGKTSSFKRCLFLRRIGDARVADRLVAAVENRPSRLCYLHLLQGGGAVGDIAADATAFGCRDWDFACIISGVWPRDEDGCEIARSAIQWVYTVAKDLLSFSSGAYGADLGPDQRDTVLAAKAFGPNGPRLARLKSTLDPHNVLAYVCPLQDTLIKAKLIILVTGESCVGKDYCADVWASAFMKRNGESLMARTVSISYDFKREYAAAAGADLSRLLQDRVYKEQHRPAMKTLLQERLQQRPDLLEEQFLNVVNGAVGVDVLLITGMRDEAPVATLSHLVPHSRLLQVDIQVSEHTRRIRRECHDDFSGANSKQRCDNNESKSTALDYCPSFIFENETMGNEAAESFAERYLLPFLHKDLHRLANMVHPIPDFPHPGVEFRHVLGIARQPGGLNLCTSLLQNYFTGDWAKVDAVACCEVGGFVYASALASLVDVPLVLIREAGKLPPPTISTIKCPSFVSSSASGKMEKRIEMERNAIPRGASVLVVDDVLSTGETLSAILQLLNEAGVRVEDVNIMVVAEFPVHRGRRLLRKRGFGRILIQSLLVFDGI